MKKRETCRKKDADFSQAGLRESSNYCWEANPEGKFLENEM